jgi:hypothetical protein
VRSIIDTRVGHWISRQFGADQYLRVIKSHLRVCFDLVDEWQAELGGLPSGGVPPPEFERLRFTRRGLRR